MKRASSNGISATTLRIILSISLFLITGLAGGGFLLAQTALQDYAVEVSHKKIDAAASNGTIKALEATKIALTNNQDIVEKANELKYSAEFPEFKIVEIVTAYAAKDGLTISSFDFAADEAPTAGGAVAAPLTPATTPTGTTQPTGNKSVSMTVTFYEPIIYANFLQFIYDIEQNLPKMQIKGISLLPGASRDSIKSTPLIIEMYTR